MSIDETKKWSEISRHVNKNIIPIIGQALDGRFRYNLGEIKYVLQSLHRHRREKWQIEQDPEKAKFDKRRKGINTRRGEVSIFFTI